MAEPRFDPGGFFEFDLSKGAVRTREGARVLLLSDDVLSPLVAVAVQNGDLTAVRRLGKQLGQHIASSLGQPPSELSPETVLSHAASVLALFGWGRIGLEQWGPALAVVVRGVPELDEGHLGMAALLGGLFSAMTGNDVACVPTDEERFLLVSSSVAEEVWSWAREGLDMGSILSRLEETV